MPVAPSWPGWRRRAPGLRAAAPALPAAATRPRCRRRPRRARWAPAPWWGWRARSSASLRPSRPGMAAPRLLLAGGDAATLLPWLDGEWRHDPLLTLRGLQVALEAPCAG
ncbi:MAG: hypothetical protein U5K43_15270 [Halofilum sp. (in: g-proteobacteria)]|nr:hypothetical protein [Halofilum sp. (in: g-proteobacteria)]